MTGTLFRGIRKPPVKAEDFLSQAEIDRNNCDDQECEAWGLSVWVSVEDVEHARKIQRYTRKWHIASGKITPNDGVILKTPSRTQPNHHTFWAYQDVALWKRFSIVMNPTGDGNVGT